MWHVRTANGSIGFTGYAVTKPAKHSRVLEIRSSSGSSQIDVRDVLAVTAGSSETVQGQRQKNTFVMQPCVDQSCCDPFDPDICPAVPADTACDSGVSFCCYVRGKAYSIPCGPPAVVNGAGCEYDEYCGDDGNGNVAGVGYFPFPAFGFYCYYDFVATVAACYAGNGGADTGPINLFSNWTVKTPTLAELTCHTARSTGFAYAGYSDVGASPRGVTGFARKHFYDTANGSGVFNIAYPGDFSGVTNVTQAAAMQSREYRTIIPLNIGNNEIGWCNSNAH